MPKIPGTGGPSVRGATSARTNKDKRRYSRYLVFWPAAIYSVDPANSAAILHGTTCEVSKNGAAILSDKNILLESITPAVMQMTIPPFSLGQQAKTIEFPCCMVYSYLSSRHSKFKVGVDFLELSKDSKVLLDQALSVARSFISVAT